jgi:hypothetical protein
MLDTIPDVALEIVEMACLAWRQAFHQHFAAAGMADAVFHIQNVQSVLKAKNE